MPAYGFPGVAVRPRGARITGCVAVALVALALVAWRVAPTRGDENRLDVTLLTEQIGEGITDSTAVRLDGVKVGSVSSIEAAGVGWQRIGVRLDKSQLFGLTDAVSVAYTPGNLFGISELDLTPGAGGTELRNGAIVDLTGANANRAYDATLSTLLRSVGQLSTDVLTPKFTSVVNKIAHDTRAFTPLFQAIVTTATSVADSQRYATSFLLGQFGDALAGVPPTLDGGFRMLNGPFVNEYLQSDEYREKANAIIDLVANQLIPQVAAAAGTARPYFQGYTENVFAPLLNTLAASVSAPERSARDLSVLLDRLGAAFHNGPDGSVLNIDVTLRGVPALAQPLLGGAPPPGASLPGLPVPLPGVPR
ncbi:MlaD family protein [Nocardia sp. NPDC059228]|uniref:MlaD family protein n=1 Tax=Nocardia sp. NPDC059228 TaxID=3346777 RepID=UPI0036C76FC8